MVMSGEWDSVDSLCLPRESLLPEHVDLGIESFNRGAIQVISLLRFFLLLSYLGEDVI
jgi:hypothetical protein